MKSDVTPGDILDGKYRVERVLGAGGMGVVVLAMHERLEQRVAIKLLLPNMRTNAELVSRFAREARAAARIKSEHVARVLDVASLPDGSPYIAMEYLEGQDLRQIFRERGPFPIQFLADCFMQALDAISDAHRVGVVHRDLKPANLFLATIDGERTSIKVLDFGISKLDNDLIDPALTSDVAMLGSPIYMAPEQVRMSHDVDQRADIWSVGASMYELATGVRPFPREAIAQIVTAILFDVPVPPSQIRPGIPPAFDALVLKCLEKDPARRFASCGELALALAPLASPQASILLQRICRVGGSTSSRATRPPEIEALLAKLPPAAGRTAARVSPVSATPSAVVAPLAAAAPRRRTGLAVGLGVGAAALAVAAGLVILRAVTTPTPPRGAASTTPSASATPSASQVVVAPSATPATSAAPPAASASSVSPSDAAAPVASATPPPTIELPDEPSHAAPAPTTPPRKPVATSQAAPSPAATGKPKPKPTLSDFGPRD